MKKFFVAVALVMGLGTTVAFAGNLTSGVETVIIITQRMCVYNFRTILNNSIEVGCYIITIPIAVQFGGTE